MCINIRLIKVWNDTQVENPEIIYYQDKKTLENSDLTKCRECTKVKKRE